MAEYFFGITDKGKRRENNEDTFIVQEISNKNFLLACVIDGVGGYNGGEVAAGIARAVILEHVQQVSGNIIEKLQLAVIAANEKIQQQRNAAEGNANMACVLTCAIADIKNNKLYYSHVGDTRLYLLRDASLVKISSDHSAVGFLEESGRLSEDDAMRHPRRNEINKALGFETGIAEEADYIETGESPFLPGDTILLCSDGLSDMISSGTITSILNRNRTLSERANDLVDAANEAGGNDNITAILVENNKEPKKQVALKPVDKKNGVEGSYAAQHKTTARQQVSTARNNHRGMIIFLALLSMGLLIALSFLIFRPGTLLKNNPSIPQTTASKQKDEKLIQLIAHAYDTAKAYTMSAGGSFYTDEAVLINKDSFYLRGNGTHIIADTNYKGPAFIINSTMKHMVLDSLVFENFDAALLIQKNNIVFRNVRFINCRMPVQYAVSFPDSTISGRFKDSIFITSQSLKNR
ncbi:MAG: serine/threonine-protein phosphatase [Chitinophagaceae bacterium]|nr:serine/threonine-protein phosphatase [Chitinophagaceae bacterium]